ncbi:pimeloyl-ACP methyl ester carboxylesterase [Actinomycetospora succinea]|uniref:Pimeloyl-ACP methyl ester carboxylesterase n=1 Tax=Actinomycetospora succinea TaxID=663603 RepID=A0A4R6VMK4_9PSEU|nr:alpha/beta hydrolase [Actinomycetospora succinea]TDQ60565.1 pimeloyl-ACP methyl ester carboxylesterase [Actinomycetospora succinea]
MPTVELDHTTIHYDETGPDTGRPVVFVHGYAMGQELWAPLAERLAARGLRCLAPTWPLGAHRTPLRPGADATLPGVAATIGGFLEALGLSDVVLVGNDTGGLVSQLVAVHHGERLGALVLTSCDAFEHFPPPILKPFVLASRNPTTWRAAVKPLALEIVRRRAYGGLAHADVEPLATEWVRPVLGDPGVAEDLRRLTFSLDRQTSLDVAARLGEVTVPALIAWSADDAFFPLNDAHRLAAALPRAEVRVLQGARTFSMLDRPDELADAVTDIAVPATS